MRRGTGGTITGTSRYITSVQTNKKLISIAVGAHRQPGDYASAQGTDAHPDPTKIQGIGAGFIPGNLDLSVVDRVEQVTNEESMEMARRLAREEGILAGISSGAAVAAAVRVAQEPEMKGKMLVVVLPDSGERYLSTPLFEGISGE